MNMTAAARVSSTDAAKFVAAFLRPVPDSTPEVSAVEHPSPGGGSRFTEDHSLTCRGNGDILAEL